jgi:tetratricopeptide (TPR) repeat protein
MRNDRLLHATAAAALTAAMVVAAGSLRLATDRPYDVEVVPRPAAARWLSLGHPLLASHYYWLKTVQYIGEERADFRGWDKLLPLVELVTDLDPGHGYAYQVAGVVLASAGRVQESNAILEKGTRLVPGRYILPYLRAFNAFYHEGDWALAARWLEVAAKAPGAPDHVKRYVLASYVKAGRAEAAAAFLENVLAETRDPESRKAIEEELRQARFEVEAARLDEAVAEYGRRFGTPPRSVGALQAAGLAGKVPPDPWGGAYVIGKDGRVGSSVHGFRYAPAPSPAELYHPALGRPAEKRPAPP